MLPSISIPYLRPSRLAFSTEVHWPATLRRTLHCRVRLRALSAYLLISLTSRGPTLRTYIIPHFRDIIASPSSPVTVSYDTSWPLRPRRPLDGPAATTLPSYVLAAEHERSSASYRPPSLALPRLPNGNLSTRRASAAGRTALTASSTAPSSGDQPGALPAERI